MTRNRAPLNFAARALFVFVMIAALLPVGLASASDGSSALPQDAADKRCPLPADGDDVKVNTPGSASSDGATVTAGPRSASWSAFEGYEITGACVKIGGKDNNLVFFGAGDGGYTAGKYDISHVVVYVKAVEDEDEDGENPGGGCEAEDGCDPGDEGDPDDGCEADDSCDPDGEDPGDECAAADGCEPSEDGNGEPIEEEGGDDENPGDDGNDEEPGDDGNDDDPGDDGNDEEPGDNGGDDQPEEKRDEQEPAEESTGQPGSGGQQRSEKPAGSEAPAAAAAPAPEAVLNAAVEAPAELPYLGAAPIPAEAPHTGGLDATSLPIVLVALLMVGALVGLLRGANARQNA